MTRKGDTIHPELKSRKWLIDHLITRGMTVKATGDEIGVSDNTILRWCRYHEIEIRKMRQDKNDRIRSMEKARKARFKMAYAVWPGH